MRKIKKEVVEAIEFKQNNPSLSIAKVAEIYKIDRHTLSKYLNMDLSNYKYFYSGEYYELDNKEQEAINAYLLDDTVTFSEIQKRFGYKPETFKKKLSVIGEDSNRRYKHNFNRQAFEKIETEEDAYWLGFILADGYLNEERGTLSIRVGEVDRSHLQKFCKYIGCSEELIKPAEGGFGTNCFVVSINSKEISSNLVKHGIFQGKSGKELPNLNIKDPLKKHYIRGIIDGDGWILKTLNGFGLVGSKEICQYLLDDLDIPNNVYEHGTIWRVDIRNKEYLRKFIERYYRDANIFLDRKMRLAQAVMKTLN